MSGSQQEMQEVLDRIFELLGERGMASGQVVIHFSDGGRYQGAEVNKVHRPGRTMPLRKVVT